MPARRPRSRQFVQFVLRDRAAGQPEFRRQFCEKQREIFCVDQFQQAIGFLEGDHEIHAYRQVAGQLEKVLLVQHAMAAEAGDGTERSAAVDAQFLRPFQQPLIQKYAVMAAVLMHEEAQIDALRSRDHAKALASAWIETKPSTVIASEPIRCNATIASAQAYSARSSSVTVSAEKVENVVRPPR